MKEIDQKTYIFGAIFILANRLQKLGDKLDENVTVKQWSLMAIISKCEHTAPTLSEVAEMIGSSRQNVKKMALILENQGFVTLNKDTIDARIIRLSLTPKCMKYFQTRAHKEQEFIENLYQGFDNDLINGLYMGVTKLAENIVKMENENGK